jgi:hypothetical protein
VFAQQKEYGLETKQAKTRYMTNVPIRTPNIRDMAVARIALNEIFENTGFS